MIGDILNLLFPPVCGICGKRNTNWLCQTCEEKIKRLEKFYYIYSNKNPQNAHIYFDKILYVFEYQSLIRKVILRYKFQDQSYLYHLFSKIILSHKKCCEILSFYDIIIPVPMYQKKKKQRGYNQTELVATEVAKTLKIPIYLDCITKIKHTKTQSTLSKKERKQNIKNAFSVNTMYNLNHKRLILFDDIYTTGATVNEIARILKENGVQEVLVFVIAKD